MILILTIAFNCFLFYGPVLEYRTLLRVHVLLSFYIELYIPSKTT